MSIHDACQWALWWLFVGWAVIASFIALVWLVGKIMEPKP